MKNIRSKNIYTYRRNVPVVIGAFILMLVLIPALIYLLGYGSENRTVLRVNGAVVSAREFKMFLVDETANTYNYFKQKHNADDGPDFWTRSYGGEIPIEYARRSALEKVTKIKIEQSMAKEKELIKDMSFQGFLKGLEAENRRRKESISQGRVIYGPVQYQQLEYYRYVHSNLLTRLKEKLGERELSISNEEIAKYYDVNRETHFKRNDEIRIQIITGTSRVSGNTKQQEVQAALERIKSAMDRGKTYEDAVKGEGADGIIKFVKAEKTLSDETARTDAEEYSVTVGKVGTLYPGKNSQIFEENGNLRFIQCVERKDMGYGDMEELRGTIKNKILDERYTEMLDKLAKEAKVEILQGVYEKIMPR